MTSITGLWEEFRQYSGKLQQWEEGVSDWKKEDLEQVVKSLKRDIFVRTVGMFAQDIACVDSSCKREDAHAHIIVLPRVEYG